MNEIVELKDGYRNLTAQLGTDRDKASGGTHVLTLLTQAQLTTSYRSSWLCKKIVNIPAEDAVSKWRLWSAEKEQISAIEAVEKQFAIRKKVKDALTLARLVGGAALYFGVGDTSSEEPINLETVGKDGLKFVALLSKNMMGVGPIEMDPESEYFGKPSHYTLTVGGTGELVKIHPSRLVIFHGEEPLDFNTIPNDGWGDSSLQAVYESCIQSDATTANVASLIFETKLDIIGIPDLMKNLSDARYEAKVRSRFALAGQLKSINGMLLLDANETFEQKTQTFAGLPDVMDRFAQAVCGAADIPMTRLFGRSPAGMNSTGEGDLKNYYDMIRVKQELEITPALANLDEVIIRSALGSRPEEIHFTWIALDQPSEKERVEMGKISADTIKTLSDAKLWPPETLAEAAANTMIESGAMPGLEAAVEEYGLERDEEPNPLEVLAAVTGGTQAGDPEEPPVGKTPAKVADATPRSLYVRRDVLNAADIVRWAKSQGYTEIIPAADMHVTVAFSRTPLDWMKVGQSYEDKLELGAGGPRVVEKFDGGAQALLFSSDILRWRHRHILNKGASWDYEDYQPHITISYIAPKDIAIVKPYTGKIVLGPEIFEEIDDHWKAR